MMQPYFKSHGKHCHLRSFPTKCRNCGDEVLYWECTHGSKLFFNYPPYGKLIQHRCKSIRNKLSKNKFKIFVKTPQGLPIQEIPNCPACGKTFKSKDHLNQHVNELKTTDLLHIQYYQNSLSFDTKPTTEKNEKAENIDKNEYKPKFGRINIKEKKQINKL